MMKSIILPILLLLAFSSFAQNHFIGIKGGVSWTNVSRTGYGHAPNHRLYKYLPNRRGFTIGLSYENRLKQHFIFGADILYQQRGVQDEVYYPVPYLNDMLRDILDNPQLQKDLKFYYDYLAVPLKCGYIIGNKISGFSNIGLVPAFLLNAIAEVPDELEIIDITDLPPKFDLAVLIEIGGNVKISERFFVTASFTYQHSLTTISNSDHFENKNFKHHGMILSGGIKYSLKKE